MYASLLLFLLIPLTGVSESTPMSNWEACMYYLEEAKPQVNAGWDEKDMQTICVELLKEGQVLIEGERDIQIYFRNMGEIVPIILM